jgi:N-methylhydantoinase B
MSYGGRLKSGVPFAFFEALGGGYGARGDLDGVDGVQAHVQNTADAQVEDVEEVYPLRIRTVELAPDSDGAGRRRGGLGICKEVEFLVDGTWSAPSDRRLFPPLGLAGGQPAAPQRYELRTPTELEWRPVQGRATLAVESGTLVRLVTPGGGGIGSPLEREPELVERDVLDGLISPERARERYGVELVPGSDGKLVIDDAATRRRRNGR